MAGPWFVRSGATGAGTGADWDNAFTTLTAANTASTAGGGETFWIADDHAESTAGAVTLTSKGVAASPNFYYCVDHTVASPGPADLRTTATIATTGNNALATAGVAYFYGIAFSCGSGAVAAIFTVGGIWVRFEACRLIKAGTTGTTSAILFSTNKCELINTQLQFGAAGDMARPGSSVVWRHTPSALAGATIPNILFAGTPVGLVTLDGVDLSAFPGTLLNGGSNAVYYSFVRCKLNASVSVGSIAAPSQRADFIQCDSAGTNYSQQRADYAGSLAQETTVIRSGGASDGTTPISWKLVSTANSRWLLPFESFPIAIWNDTINSPVTATVEIVASSALNNDDVWIEAEYLGDASSPQASFANSTKANNLATGTALPASSATWASSPGSAQKLSVTFTPQMKGYVYVRAYVAKASQTVYVDPLVTLS